MQKNMENLAYGVKEIASIYHLKNEKKLNEYSVNSETLVSLFISCNVIIVAINGTKLVF
jgi:hypothetical protein